MHVSRRSLLAAPALLAMGRTAVAADYPNKTIRLVVGFTPGGATDFVARILAEALGTKLGQQVIVENRTGAGQLVGMDYVARATPDGYTLMFASAGATTLLPALKRTMPYQMPDAFTYITRVTNSAYVLIMDPKLPYKNIQELVAFARANPGQVKFATPGVATDGDMESLLLEQAAGIKLTRVPYRGGAPALTDVMSGICQMGMQSLVGVTDQAAAGKVKLLAYTGPQRDLLAPDLPSLAEVGLAGATMTNWLGVLGPAKLPPAIRAQLEKAISACMTEPTTRDRLVKLDFDPTPVPGDKFRAQVIRELAEWKDVVQKANLPIE